MRCLSALALLLACLALPGHAQRGGARGGGFGGGGGGFHGGAGGAHGFSSPGFRGGSPGVGRPGFFSGSRPGAAPSVRAPYGMRTAPRGFAPAVSSARPNFYSRNGANFAGRAGGAHIPYTGGFPYGGRYPYGGYGGYGGRYSFGYPRFFSPRFGYPNYLSFGFFDPFFWGYDPFWDTGDWMGYDSAPYAPQASVDGGPQYPARADGYSDQGQAPQGQPYQGQSQAPQTAPDSGQTPGPWAPQAWTGEPPIVAAQERPVTLVFKDGRAPVRIRNYAMTRSVIFTGTDMREIPLDEVDVPATQRLNKAAGVDFRLP